MPRPRHGAKPRRAILAVALVASLAAIVPVPAVLAATSVDFTATGAEQQWTVPAGVTTIHVVLIGGRGGNNGGYGAKVTGDVAVLPGATIFVEVGGAGHDSVGGTPGAAAFNGGAAGGTSFAAGGGGGGASDVRTLTRTEPGSLGSRLLVAAGGGGTDGSTRSPGGAAGAAGSGSPQGVTGGGAATGTAGGTAGSPSGVSGGWGAGGEGCSWTSSNTSAGGGGGGGYFGGGGGGCSFNSDGGGGGGGSSFVGTAFNSSIQADSTGSPGVTISYQGGGGATPPPNATPGPDTGTVDADVTVPSSAACIELSTTSVTFGTQRFGSVDVQADPSITVTNCSGTDATLHARGTSAAGNGATWNLVDDAGTCAAGTLEVDAFHLKLRRPSNEVDPVTQLSSNNKEIAEMAGGDATTVEPLLDMPCAGSAGAGQTMGMNIVFVVTEIE